MRVGWVAFGILFLFGSVAHADLRAGVGVVDVTPEFEGRPANNKNPMFASMYKWGQPFNDTNGDGKFQFLYLAGFDNYFPPWTPGENRFATKVHDPIWSRAIALADKKGNKAILISVDSPGIVWKVLGPVRRKIETELGVPASNVIIAATHSHYAPDPYGFWWSFNPSEGKPYATFLQKKIFESAQKAIQNLQLVQVKTITAQTYSCYDPVTHVLKKGDDCKVPPVRKEYMTAEDKKAGPYDELLMQFDKRDPSVRNTRVVAAQFISKATGKTVTTLINWHNHPDSLLGQVMEVSSDYVHYVREYVEAKLGGKAVYFSGTVGCQIGAHPGVAAPLWDEAMNPVFEADGSRSLIKSNTWDRIRSIGYEIGAEVTAAVNQTKASEGSDAVSVATTTIDIPIDTPLHRYITRGTWTRDIAKEDAIRHDQGRCSNERGCVPTDVSLVQMGDLAMIAVPGEMDPAYFLGRKQSSADYGKFGITVFKPMPSIESHMPGKHRGVIGMANNFLAYFVPKSDQLPDPATPETRHPNYYEESVAVGSNQGDEIGNRLMEMLGSKERFAP